MADEDNSPWSMACHPAEVAACTTSTRFSMSGGAWADPALADLVAPPVTVTAADNPAPGRHRAAGDSCESGGPAEPPTFRDLAGSLAQV